MFFMHYVSIHILYNFLLILFIDISNASKIYIEDLQTFENELKKCDTLKVVEFVIINNITISNQIEISYNNDVKIHITSEDKNIYIKQDFSRHNNTNILYQDNNDSNLMINLSNAKEIKIDNIIIYGNIGVYDTDVVSITSSNIIGDIVLNKINDEFLIQNNYFKPSSEITDNGYIITIKESPKGTISNITFDADINTKQVISIHDCYNLIIKNSNFNGSLNKMKSLNEFHKVFAIYDSKKIELNNLQIQNFGDNTSEGYV